MQDNDFENFSGFVNLICAAAYMFQTHMLLLNGSICLSQVVPHGGDEEAVGVHQGQEVRR